ncbi:hypothetical protein HDF16_005781 [Granulicella aggregans]|uniref:DUF4034 domain-containing protein n=1 Tax=Granulicella aggregans TaxID=474949 RepID=A0A7W7ZJG8_9BACT|nr:DUF4034 domain-containing protein [Granulicella aggregans]MBB5061045.1 hypothetical protein [Granulicella aggregans]
MHMFASIVLMATFLNAGTLDGQATPVTSVAVADVNDSDSSFAEHVATLLIEHQFADLDRLADTLRRDRTRSRGGAWRLHEFYGALDSPLKSEPDTVAHLNLLRAWMAASPQSITARVALATSLTRWAWVARGKSFADEVAQDRWPLFQQRIQEAEAVLRGSELITPMCPQWFGAMMAVGLANGWQPAQEKAVMERGLLLEPGYFYLQEEYSTFLQPKWYGNQGEAATFAKQSADGVGGDAGDALYFRLAGVLARFGRGNTLAKEMDWQRIQEGYAALVATYGRDQRLTNELALLAYFNRDRTTALKLFTELGSQWSERVWGNRDRYEHARDWANSHTDWPE